jgi:small GTP-binding protein
MIFSIRSRDVSCVVMGDDFEQEKTKLLITYTTKAHLPEYVPVCFDNYAATVELDDKWYELSLMDSTGIDTPVHIEKGCFCYSAANVFVLFFSVVNPDSFKNITTKWVPTFSRQCPKVPIVLVGTQIELRNDTEMLNKLTVERLTSFISYEEGMLKAREIKAASYLECSTVTLEGVQEVFHEAIRVAMRQPVKHPVSAALSLPTTTELSTSRYSIFTPKNSSQKEASLSAPNLGVISSL